RARPLHTNRLNGSFEKHRVDDDPDIGMLKRNRNRFERRSRSVVPCTYTLDPALRQEAAPCILHGADHVAVRREQLSDGQVAEGRVLQYCRNMLREQIRQPGSTVMEPQDLSPEVLWSAEQVRAYAEDVGEDEVLGRAFSKRLSGVLVVRQEHGFVV